LRQQFFQKNADISQIVKPQNIRDELRQRREDDDQDNRNYYYGSDNLSWLFVHFLSILLSKQAL